MAASESTGAAGTAPRTKEDDLAVSLDPRLMDILACPVGRPRPAAPRHADGPGRGRAHLHVCGRGFPVEDGIPVLLLDEASPPVDTREG